MVKRRPRPKCTQRKGKFLGDEHFEQVCQEMTPLLFKYASQIRRPYHIDNSDLVQEALTHIFLNRDKYDERISSIMTWGLTVARRKFMNIAATGFRDKRCPKDSDKKAINPIDFEEMLFFTEDGAAISDCITLPTVENDIHERELVSNARRRLRGLALNLLDIYLDPPWELLALVNNRMHHQKLRVNHVNKQNKKSRGSEIHKQPFSFHIDNKSLSTFFKVPIHTVVKAKDSLRGELRRASKECGGEWPTVTCRA